jgi:hypothetical protein
MPEQSEPQPQAGVPSLEFRVAPESATFIFTLGNGLSIQQVVHAEAMNQIEKVWRESRKQLMAQQQLVADVMRTRR